MDRKTDSHWLDSWLGGAIEPEVVEIPDGGTQPVPGIDTAKYDERMAQFARALEKEELQRTQRAIEALNSSQQVTGAAMLNASAGWTGAIAPNRVKPSLMEALKMRFPGITRVEFEDDKIVVTQILGKDFHL